MPFRLIRSLALLPTLLTASAARPEQPPAKARATPSTKTAVKTPARGDSAAKRTKAAPVWPNPAAPAPLPGSILPAKRIVAYYGNPLSKRMGILGEVPQAE